jgi:uncharacterized protein
MIDTICFFEIPADDPEALQEFYRDMFAWTFEKIPGGFRYYKINTAQDTPRGGLTARQDPQHTPVNYVKVESIEGSVTRAEALGAKSVVERKPVPGIGWYSVLLDPQGNRIGLWEDDPAAAYSGCRKFFLLRGLCCSRVQPLMCGRA